MPENEDEFETYDEAETLHALGWARGHELAQALERLRVQVSGFAEGVREAREELAPREGEERYVVRLGEAWEAAHAEVPLRLALRCVTEWGQWYDDGDARVSNVWLGDKQLDVARGEWWPAYVGVGPGAEEIGFIARDGDAFVPHAVRSWGHQRLGRVYGKYFALEVLRREAGR